MIGLGVFSSNSVELESFKPATFLKNSIIIICRPRQIPSRGFLLNLQIFAPSIMPSIPLFPNPPGIITPSTSLIFFSKFFKSSEDIHIVSIFVFVSTCEWINASFNDI